MAKVYYISESNYKKLVEKKRQETLTFNEICEELDRKRSQITEATLLNEGILDTIKKYLRAGTLTAGILASLLASEKVNAQQLAQAGVPKQTIELAQQKVNQDGGKNTAKYNPSEMSTQQIDSRLIQIMKRNNLKGSLDRYNKLSPQEKTNLLNTIKSQVTSLDDVNHIAITGWENINRTGSGAIKFDQKTDQKISVVTVDTVSTVPVTRNFKVNSVTIENPEALKQQLKELVGGYTEIDSIIIEASSSTLRNRGEAEGMTWKELSQKRGEEVANLLIGEKIDLGGQGKNVVGEITSDMIKINSDGSNGDGTSGPKSPYEVNPEYIKTYQERGIDSSLWKSAAQEDALPETQLSAYEQYQFVKVKIYGRIVITDTQEVPSYKYVLLQVREMDGIVKTGNKREKADVSKCPVNVKINETV